MPRADSELAHCTLALACQRGGGKVSPYVATIPPRGAEIGINNTDPRRVVRVRNDGGFKKREQAHLARITSILETPLPPELVRKVLGFWLHAGYY